jgi:hypothetical protein
METLIPWQTLRTTLRSHHDQVVQDWIELLESGAGERAGMKFLNEHAGFFFCDSSRRLITISEFELGADFRPDFVVTHDFSSFGFSYEFIEIQDPNEQPLKTDGQFSKGLNEAVAQITKWNKWLAGNKDTAKRILPSREFLRDDRLAARYTIIIGRRKNQDSLLALRNYNSDNLNIQIRSFDYLTETLQERYFAPLPNLASFEMDQVDTVVRNKLVNPFRMAIPSAEWRRVVSTLEDRHMSAKNAATFVNVASANTRLQPFLEAWQDLSEVKRQVYLDEINFIKKLGGPRVVQTEKATSEGKSFPTK